MQAVVFDQLGGPDVLRVAEIPVPTLQSGQVLVKVQAVAVDHVDTFIRSGAYQTPLATPHVVGRDLVGTVAKISEPDSPFEIGQAVWTNSAGYEGRMGATAAYVAVAADRLYPVPAGVDAQQLVAAVHSAATAAIILTDVMALTAGQALLIEGAAGNVGRKFIQLAHQLGAFVATTSSPADFARCRDLGSDLTLDYHADLAATLPTNHQAFDHVIDTSGRVALQTNLDLLRLNGQVTLITAPQDNQFNFAVRQFYMNQKRLAGFVISHATATQLKRAADWLNRSFAQGQLLDDQVAVRPFGQASQVHAALENGQDHRQRFVLVPDTQA